MHTVRRIKKASEKFTKMATGGDDRNGECLTRKVVEKESMDSYRYYLSRRTVLEMLKDRGYDIPNAELSGSLTEFRSVFGDKPDVERLRLCVPLLSNPSKKILVVYLGTEEIRTQIIRGIFGQIVNKESLHGLILILQSKMNHFARKEVQKFPSKVEIFQITELLVNITKHILVPKHELLTVEEKQKLLEKYRLEDKQLPRMLQTDALARYYGLEKGQVLKLTYCDGITESLETYRCVL